MIFLMDWCRSLGHSVTDSIDKMNGIVAKKKTTRERAYCPMHKNTEECDRKRERKREIWKHRKFIAVDGIQSILILLNFYETKIIITDCEIVRFETYRTTNSKQETTNFVLLSNEPNSLSKRECDNSPAIFSLGRVNKLYSLIAIEYFLAVMSTERMRWNSAWKGESVMVKDATEESQWQQQ